MKIIDESGVNIAMSRRYGRARPGLRVSESLPRNYGKNITMIGALGIEGLSAVMTIDGATDGDVFEAYVEQVLLPTLRSRDIVVMDNLGAHKGKRIKDLIEGAGAEVKFLPSYSPDLSPIEECWSKVKTLLRSKAARTREALEEAIKEAIIAVSRDDARGWFKHCGYAVH